MVRKNYKWNISKEEGEKLINDTIQEILSNKGVMEISELNFFIQSHSRDITIKKVNITTTSYPLVLIKNGRLIALAVRYIIEPI